MKKLYIIFWGKILLFLLILSTLRSTYINIEYEMIKGFNSLIIYFSIVMLILLWILELLYYYFRNEKTFNVGLSACSNLFILPLLLSMQYNFIVLWAITLGLLLISVFINIYQIRKR